MGKEADKRWVVRFGAMQRLGTALCIAIVAFISYLVLRFSARGALWLSPIALNITTRIMGLLLAAVAIQFMINALRELNPAWLARPG